MGERRNRGVVAIYPSVKPGAPAAGFDDEGPAAIEIVSDWIRLPRYTGVGGAVGGTVGIGQRIPSDVFVGPTAQYFRRTGKTG